MSKDRTDQEEWNEAMIEYAAKDHDGLLLAATIARLDFLLREEGVASGELLEDIQPIVKDYSRKRKSGETKAPDWSHYLRVVASFAARLAIVRNDPEVFYVEVDRWRRIFKAKAAPGRDS